MFWPNGVVNVSQLDKRQEIQTKMEKKKKGKDHKAPNHDTIVVAVCVAIIHIICILHKAMVTGLQDLGPKLKMFGTVCF